MTAGRGHREYLILKIVPTHAGRLRLRNAERPFPEHGKGL